MHAIRVTSATATTARFVAKHVHAMRCRDTRDKTEQRAKKEDKRDFRTTIAMCLYGSRVGGEL